MNANYYILTTPKGMICDFCLKTITSAGRINIKHINGTEINICKTCGEEMGSCAEAIKGERHA